MVDHLDIDIYNNSSDERDLDKMPEAEKEKILYERYKRLLRMKERKELEEKLSETENKEMVPKSEFLSDDHNNGTIITEDAGERILQRKISLEEIQHVVLRRNDVAEHVYRPDFLKIIGNYVLIRLMNGTILGKITNLEEGEEIYEVQGRKNKFKTNYLMTVNCGSKVYKNIKLMFISNAEITHEMYEKLEKENFLPKKSQKEKFKSIIMLFKSKMSAKDLDESIKIRQRFYPLKISRAREKIKLVQKIKELTKYKRFDEAKVFQDKLDHMNEEDAKKNLSIWDRLNEKKNLEKNKSLDITSKEKKPRDPVSDALNPFIRKKNR